MYKKRFIFCILVCILLSGCKKEKEETAQKIIQTEIETKIETEKSTEIVVDEITSGENILEAEAPTIVLESSSDCAVPNKYFTKDDVFTAKGINETIKTIDEKHFLQYLQNLIKSNAYEKKFTYFSVCVCRNVIRICANRCLQRQL